MPSDPLEQVPAVVAGRASSRRRVIRNRSLSVGASIAVHAVLMMAAAALVWRVAEPRMAGSQTIIDFEAPQLGDAAVATSAAASPPVRRPAEVSIEMPATPVQPATRTELNPPKLEGLVSAPASSESSQVVLSDSTGLAGGLVTASQTNAPADQSRSVVAKPINFAGLGASNAKSVVYVVDCSGSMVTSLPFVIAEVQRSVAGLAPTQKFGVVLFRRGMGADSGAAGDSVEIFAPVLLRATESARERLAEWLAGARPSGRSAPLAGLERALSYMPDAVFLLSRSIERSGGNVWDLGMSDTMARIEQLNPQSSGGGRPVLIQTVQFLDDDPTGIMQEIGRIHGARTDASGRKSSGYRVIKRGEDLAGGGAK